MNTLEWFQLYFVAIIRFDYPVAQVFAQGQQKDRITNHIDIILVSLLLTLRRCFRQNFQC